MSFPAGMASLEARVTSDRDGRLLRCLVTGGVTDLTVPGGAGPSDGLRLEFEAAGSLEDFKKALLERVSGQLQQGAQRLAQLSGLAQVNLRNREFSGQFSADATLPGLLKMHPVDGLRLSAGTATAAVQVDTQNGQTNISAGFACSGLTGDLFGVAIRDYAAKVDLGARLGPDKVLLQRGMVSLQAGSDAPGSIELSGEFEPVAKRGDFRFKGVNLNEKSLAPLVARTLHPRRLGPSPFRDLPTNRRPGRSPPGKPPGRHARVVEHAAVQCRARSISVGVGLARRSSRSPRSGRRREIAGGDRGSH